MYFVNLVLRHKTVRVTLTITIDHRLSPGGPKPPTNGEVKGVPRRTVTSDLLSSVLVGILELNTEFGGRQDTGVGIETIYVQSENERRATLSLPDPDSGVCGRDHPARRPPVPVLGCPSVQRRLVFSLRFIRYREGPLWSLVYSVNCE